MATRTQRWQITQRSSQGNVYCVMIYDNGDVNSNLYNFTGAAVSAEWKHDDEEDVSKAMRPQTGYIRVVLRNDADRTAYREMLPAKPLDRKVVIKNTTTNSVVFVGYLSVEMYNQKFCEYVNDVEIPIVSPLGALSNRKCSIANNTVTGLDFIKKLCDECYENVIISTSAVSGMSQLYSTSFPYAIFSELDSDTDTYVVRSKEDALTDMLTAFGMYAIEKGADLYLLPYYGIYGAKKYTRTEVEVEGKTLVTWLESTVAAPEGITITNALAIEGKDHMMSDIQAFKSLKITERLNTDGTSDLSLEDEAYHNMVTQGTAGGEVTIGGDTYVCQAFCTVCKQRGITLGKFDNSGARKDVDSMIHPKHTTALGQELATDYGAIPAKLAKFKYGDTSISFSKGLLICGGKEDSTNYTVKGDLKAVMEVSFPMPVIPSSWLYITGDISESEKEVKYNEDNKLTGTLYASIKVGNMYYQYSNTTTDKWTAEPSSAMNIPVTAICGSGGNKLTGGHKFSSDSGTARQKAYMGWKEGFWVNMPSSQTPVNVKVTFYAPYGIKPNHWLIIENLQIGMKADDDAVGFAIYNTKEKVAKEEFENDGTEDMKMEIALGSVWHTKDVVTNYCFFHGCEKLLSTIKSQFASKKEKLVFNDSRAVSTNIMASYTYNGKNYKIYSQGFNTSDERGEQTFIELKS